jgi:hypothetical protein
MPQLAKGGKWVFGWSAVSGNGTIVIPPEAFNEYGFQDGENVILMNGSKTSGGFTVTTQSRLSKSKLPVPIEEISGAGIIHIGNRLFYSTKINAGSTIQIPLSIIHGYGIKIEDRLLAVRGSGLGTGFIVRGPIVQEALRHPELKTFYA